MLPLDISNGWKTVIMIVAMIAVFYFFLIRPQSKQLKEEEAYRDSLKKGDRVMTSKGIHVTIVSIDGSNAVVEVAPDVRIKVLKSILKPIPERPRQ